MTTIYFCTSFNSPIAAARKKESFVLLCNCESNISLQKYHERQLEEVTMMYTCTEGQILEI